MLSPSAHHPHYCRPHPHPILIRCSHPHPISIVIFIEKINPTNVPDREFEKYFSQEMITHTDTHTLTQTAVHNQNRQNPNRCWLCEAFRERF